MKIERGRAIPGGCMGLREMGALIFVRSARGVS